MSRTLNRLVRMVKAIDKTHHKYKLLMKYDGETIAEYDMSSGERTIDMKSPEQWVRGNIFPQVAILLQQGHQFQLWLQC